MSISGLMLFLDSSKKRASSASASQLLFGLTHYEHHRHSAIHVIRLTVCIISISCAALHTGLARATHITGISGRVPLVKSDRKRASAASAARLWSQLGQCSRHHQHQWHSAVQHLPSAARLFFGNRNCHSFDGATINCTALRLHRAGTLHRGVMSINFTVHWKR